LPDRSVTAGPAGGDATQTGETKDMAAKQWRVGDCVRLTDGRIGRVREVLGAMLRVRVRRSTSATHQFLMLKGNDAQRADCPAGWMSPRGYARYLKATLAKLRARQAESKGRRRRRPS
jgi:hypothetical protein